LLPGGSYFFTVNLADRRRALLTDHIDVLRAAFRRVRARHPFMIEAAVILPDHLHAIWTLPDGDADFATRWYWEHTLRDEDDFVRHLDYIHFNPVKHGHAVRVRDWPFSSFRRWGHLGAYPVDWAGDPGDQARSFGE
jgi:REP-associated tyrosine transposase